MQTGDVASRREEKKWSPLPHGSGLYPLSLENQVLIISRYLSISIIPEEAGFAEAVVRRKA